MADTCSICRDPLSASAEEGVWKRIMCRGGHRFHRYCLIEWSRINAPDTCPLCKAQAEETDRTPPPTPTSSRGVLQTEEASVLNLTQSFSDSLRFNRTSSYIPTKNSDPVSEESPTGLSTQRSPTISNDLATSSWTNHASSSSSARPSGLWRSQTKLIVEDYGKWWWDETDDIPSSSTTQSGRSSRFNSTQSQSQRSLSNYRKNRASLNSMGASFRPMMVVNDFPMGSPIKKLQDDYSDWWKKEMDHFPFPGIPASQASPGSLPLCGTPMTPSQCSLIRSRWESGGSGSQMSASQSSQRSPSIQENRGTSDSISQLSDKFWNSFWSESFSQ